MDRCLQAFYEILRLSVRLRMSRCSVNGMAADRSEPGLEIPLGEVCPVVGNQDLRHAFASEKALKCLFGEGRRGAWSEEDLRELGESVLNDEGPVAPQEGPAVIRMQPLHWLVSNGPWRPVRVSLGLRPASFALFQI